MVHQLLMSLLKYTRISSMCHHVVLYLNVAVIKMPEALSKTSQLRWYGELFSVTCNQFIGKLSWVIIQYHDTEISKVVDHLRAVKEPSCTVKKLLMEGHDKHFEMILVSKASVGRIQCNVVCWCSVWHRCWSAVPCCQEDKKCHPNYLPSWTLHTPFHREVYRSTIDDYSKWHTLLHKCLQIKTVCLLCIYKLEAFRIAI